MRDSCEERRDRMRKWKKRGVRGRAKGGRRKGQKIREQMRQLAAVESEKDTWRKYFERDFIDLFTQCFFPAKKVMTFWEKKKKKM